MGGDLRFSAVTLLILALMVFSAASSRVLLDDDKNSPSPTPNPRPSNVEKPASTKNEHVAPAGNPTGDMKKNKSKEGESPKSSNEPAGASKGSPPVYDKSKDVMKEEESLSPKSSKDDVVKEVCTVRCQDSGKLFACLNYSSGSNKLDILLKNKGESDLTVKIKTRDGPNHEDQKVPRSGSQKISISIPDWNGTEIALNAGNGDCILHLAPRISDRNFPQFPTPTPIHGVYLLAFAVIIVGGTWACCKFRNKEQRHDSGVPYQQLEMGIQPSSGSAIVESGTADGWDENWDDDWDEEEGSTNLPDKRPSAKVSTNGVSSKTPNKDGWDEDWDD